MVKHVEDLVWGQFDQQHIIEEHYSFGWTLRENFFFVRDKGKLPGVWGVFVSGQCRN